MTVIHYLQDVCPPATIYWSKCCQNQNYFSSLANLLTGMSIYRSCSLIVYSIYLFLLLHNFIRSDCIVILRFLPCKLFSSFLTFYIILASRVSSELYTGLLELGLGLGRARSVKNFMGNILSRDSCCHCGHRQHRPSEDLHNENRTLQASSKRRFAELCRPCLCK